MTKSHTGKRTSNNGRPLVLQLLVPLVVVGVWPRRDIAANEAATVATRALHDDLH